MLYVGIAILCIFYMWLAVRLGYRILDYRSQWLDGSGFLNRSVKFLLALLIGSTLGGFYFFWLIVKWTIGAAAGK